LYQRVGSCPIKMNYQHSNPVGALHERFQSRGMKPKYQVIKATGAAHAPTFSFQVVMGDLTSLGRGSSKKEAKNAAAVTMLELLDKKGIAKQLRKPEVSDSVPVMKSKELPMIKLKDLEPVMKPKDPLPMNSIEMLYELCTRHGYRVPDYEDEREQRFPLGTSFSIICCVGELRKTGVGTSKDGARNEAAQRMLDMLRSFLPKSNQDTPVIVETQQHIERAETQEHVERAETQQHVESAETMQHVESAETMQHVERAESQQHVERIDTQEHVEDRVDEISNKMKLMNNVPKKNVVGPTNHHRVKTAVKSKLSILHVSSLDDMSVDYVSMLKELGKEQKFVVTCVEEKLDDLTQCLIQLSTVPVAVSYAIGTDFETVQNNAARDILLYLKMLTKPTHQ